ncbi:PstS family phosphate ABC transporter substrate-binding protein [Flavobacterium undicola]|uniref:PstS family phosphate ABC transporter substrate-binding protein n=1 Tax=Flavobacterium undicola TaxID=1932779 RepID=UPI001378DDBB|nr:substrate-binding domain-containing protein [Flavobacterium undicola]MBA0884139.1 substrate-binding domain-containing protein [Flavobacterium undicola]
MKKIILLLSVFFFFAVGVFVSCKQSDSKKDKETILKGKAILLVDETIKPLIEDQIAVFESTYNAKIVLEAKSEKEVMKAFLKDTSRIVVLSRELNTDEIKFFDQLKIKPKTTKIATDAIALISNKKDTDTLIAIKDVVAFLKGSAQTKIKGLVFDNPNSSTVRYMTALAGVKQVPQKGVYSFKSNEEVVKFVAENDGMIGIVGVNWLLQPTVNIKDYLTNINVLSVKGLNKNSYFAPTQNNLAEGTYPLARDLFIVNCQGYSGLGMGFASFLAGEIGQRIVLKSGMLPTTMPGRKILIRNK